MEVACRSLNRARGCGLRSGCGLKYIMVEDVVCPPLAAAGFHAYEAGAGREWGCHRLSPSFGNLVVVVEIYWYPHERH